MASDGGDLKRLLMEYVAGRTSGKLTRAQALETIAEIRRLVRAADPDEARAYCDHVIGGVKQESDDAILDHGLDALTDALAATVRELLALRRRVHELEQRTPARRE